MHPSGFLAGSVEGCRMLPTYKGLSSQKVAADGALSRPQAEVVCDEDFAHARTGVVCYEGPFQMFFGISAIVVALTRGCSLPRDAEKLFPNWTVP